VLAPLDPALGTLALNQQDPLDVSGQAGFKEDSVSPT
jgi:hypothetical protein